MESFALYILKSAIWLTGFTVVYMLFLQNERYFRLKRYYLITGLIASLFLPLLTIRYNVIVQAPQVPTESITYPAMTGTPATGITTAGEAFGFSYALLFLYLAGLAFFTFRFINHIIRLSAAINRTRIPNNGQSRLIRAPEFSGSFSFFRYVFINPSVSEAELKIIMSHETVHVSQKHWVDLLLAELLKLIQWANPFVWIYTGFIRQNHEYIADEVALQRTPDPAVYKAVLVNQIFGSLVFSLTNTFNFSLNKKRFEMMKKTASSPYRKFKILLVLPVFAIVLYAFSEPVYSYTPSADNGIPPAEIYDSPVIQQKEVRGLVTDENGKPLVNVNVATTGTAGNAYWTTTASDGRFVIANIPDNSSIFFNMRGYKVQTLKPVFGSEMIIKLEKDPNYRPQGQPGVAPGGSRQAGPIVAIDGVITDKSFGDARRDLGYNMGEVKQLFGKEATDKYGEKAANGVWEITTRKKALEMGLKPPFPRLGPQDYPTFQGQRFDTFKDWVVSHASYPEEAKSKNIEGWVSVNFIVNLDGSISNITPTLAPDKLLSDEVVNVIRTAPKWDPPKNPAVDEPFRSTVTMKFQLPDQMLDEEPFVVVEEMPLYPGGEQQLLNFIQDNTRYPEEAKAQGIEGRVILRFIVNTKGGTEGISVLKGIDPALDAEAIRVVSMLSGFRPGMQGGKPVNVWYMVPVNFALPKPE